MQVFSSVAVINHYMCRYFNLVACFGVANCGLLCLLICLYFSLLCLGVMKIKISIIRNCALYRYLLNY